MAASEGLDGLRDRLKTYRQLGVSFATWRSVLRIDDALPSATCLHVKAHALARFAALSQEKVTPAEGEASGKSADCRARSGVSSSYTEMFSCFQARRPANGDGCASVGVVEYSTITLSQAVTSNTVNSLTVPSIKTRRAETTLEIPSGGAMAMAGLIQEQTKQAVNGLPGLMQLPVLGTLFRSRDYVNLIVIDKQPELQWLDMDDAVRHCTDGASIWPWASNDQGGEPDVVGEGACREPLVSVEPVGV